MPNEKDTEDDPWANVKPVFGFPRHYLAEDVDRARSTLEQQLMAAEAQLANLQETLNLVESQRQTIEAQRQELIRLNRIIDQCPRCQSKSQESPNNQ